MKNTYKSLVGNPEEKGPQKRPWSRREDNTGMNLRETRWKDVDWMHLTQDRDQWSPLVNTVMNFQVPLKAGDFLTS
jgi:hypothetical protein